MESIIGIDLGTTNSAVAILRQSGPVILEGDGVGLLPSVVGLGEQGGFLVGEPALNQLLVAPERTVRSIKRRMGSPEKVLLGDRELSPPEVSAKILAHLKRRAESVLGAPVEKAVITVPAFFDDAQRRATLEAGELAGLEVVRLLHEPTAAALVYDPDLSRRRTVLVYDLGGGTFDCSIVEIEAGVMEVRASHGDTRLGGDDFDELLLESIAARFEEQHGVDLTALPRTAARLRRAVERAKCRLSFEPFATIEEEFVAEKGGSPLHLSIEISRGEYEDLIRPLVARTMESVQEALSQAKVLVKDLDGVVLVGGSTRTPLVRETLQARTGREAHHSVHPDLCVALGAAIQAGSIAGEKVERLLVDITPHTFGVRCVSAEDGRLNPLYFSRVIPRGSILPTTRAEAYSTFVDNQEVAEIEVFQGENPLVTDNTSVGRFLIEGLAEVPSGNVIVVQFQLTLDGMLTVTATEKATGLSKNIVIERASATSTGKSLVTDATWSPEEDDEDHEDHEDHEEATANVAGEGEESGGERRAAFGLAEAGRIAPAAVAAIGELDAAEVRRTIDRIRGLFATLTPEDREDATRLIAQVERGIAAQPPLEDAVAAHEELKEILFYVEES